MTTAPLAGRHVLIVDDDEDTRELLRAAIELEGGRVAEASDAEHAIAVLQGTHFDVVVADFHLGDAERNGPWLLQQARAAGSPVPFIAITGRKDLEAELLRTGFALVLIKPVDPFDVPARLAMLLAQRAA